MYLEINQICQNEVIRSDYVTIHVMLKYTADKNCICY